MSAAAPTTHVARRRIIAWAAWDWGTSAYSSLITTFVFARYIVSDYFIDPQIVSAYLQAGGKGSGGTAEQAYLAAQAHLSEGIAWALAIGGFVIALTAPIFGARSDASGRQKRSLGALTVTLIAICFGLFFVAPHPGYFVFGATLLGVGAVVHEVAFVNYNALLVNVATPRSMGRVSGLGWGAGYFGSIFALLIALFGFVLGEQHWFGITDVDAMNLRVVFVLAGLWAIVFAFPLFGVVPEVPRIAERQSLWGSYVKLWRDLVDLYRTNRLTFGFLVASAVYRDGLAAVFSFGGILAGTVFGFGTQQVIFFAIAANLCAGVGVVIGGILDDRIGPLRVIMLSLVGLVTAGTALFLLRDSGAWAFWLFGLALTLFVGPAQSAGRSFLARLAPEGRAGEIFGLYATTGRAISFVAPSVFSLFVAWFGATAFGILGIVGVILIGLVLIVPVERQIRKQALAG